MPIISKISNGGTTYDIRDKILGIIGSGAPTTTTIGSVGQIYEDNTNGILYICTMAGSGTYTWERVGKDPVLYSSTGQHTDGAMTQKATTDALDDKVDKVSGKGLSTNDYTTAEKTKLAGIAAGAEVNVQADWEQTDTTADDFIKNKPTIPDVILYDTTGQNTDGAMTQKAVSDELADINGLIPGEATTSNQLADKNFVNSSIATNTANFLGTLDVEDDLGLEYGATTAEIAIALNAHSFAKKTNNDYVFAVNKDSADNIIYQRFKYTAEDQVFAYEYTLNNSSFTAAQWATINAGLTAADKTKLDGIAAGAQVNVQSDWNATTGDAFIKNKPANLVQDASYVHTDNNYTTAEKNKLAGIAAGAEVNVQADWEQDDDDADDFIKNKPEDLVQDASYVHTDNNYTTTEKNKLAGVQAGAEANVQSDWNQTDTNADDFIKNKPVIPEGAKLYATTGQNTDGAMTQKAATDEFGKYLAKTGGTMSGNINMGSNAITALLTPTGDYDAATKKYVDDNTLTVTVQGETLTIL